MKTDLQSYFKNKKILITGHTGFKGTWLLKILSMLGSEIKGIALEPNENQLFFNQIQGTQLCEHSIIDICDYESLENEILNFEPDIIFHLAAQALVRPSYSLLRETYMTNVIGTLNVLESIKKLSKKCNAVLITTDKVYENFEKDYLYIETDSLGGHDPYSSSKAACEILISSFRKSFIPIEKYDQHNKCIASARAGNVIGGGDLSQDRIVPDIVKSVQKGIPVTLRNPNAIRPFQHVLESLRGYLLLAIKMEIDPVLCSTSYNFGPSKMDCISVLELVQKCIKEYGIGNYNIEPQNSYLHEAGILMLDNSKSKNDLGWIPQWDIDKTIKETITWYRTNEEEKNMITEAQIKYYFNL
ncbi:MAG TPA: CDP-glucose 4,6-dehydratase [Saprospiraceae bacterium]|nr:CDP-glucose 4,6-dehydratase [Saprospiraceae bacterium]